MISEQQNKLRCWLALNHLYNLTADDISGIVQHADHLEELFKISILRKKGFSENFVQQVQQLNWDKIDEELVWSAMSNHSVVTLADDFYPNLLREISNPPLLLYVKGDIELLSQPQLAIVGSRNPTPVGSEIAKQFAAHLAQSGFVITSGLAMGIDGAAHEGALETGKTVAVCGTGLNSIYPARHEELAQKISESGALISEFPLNTLPRKENFPQRNRIISGLSVGTLVVEAAGRSGSLITARLAGEQGREVFAIPGSIHNPLAKGCHALIRQGAKLVETAEDITNELRGFTKLNKELSQADSKSTKKSQKKSEKNIELPLDFISLDKDYKKLLFCVGFESTAVDTIIDRSDLSTEVVSSMLLMLELQGYIQSVPGGYIRSE